ncbi:MAG: hypothetical protein U5L04_01725 [Trueperaceae bacterium]|nr:hypothetical protein [Trueperaceae bacterium]
MGYKYTVSRCEQRIKDLDDKIERYEDLPQVMRDGPVSANHLTKLKDLRAERRTWERRLEEAERRARGANSLQGPDIEVV